MSVIREEDARTDIVDEVARRMMVAARTAPKGKGIDNLEIAVLDEEGINRISKKLAEIVERDGTPAFFRRDMENVLAACRMVLIGTRIRSLGIQPCGMCGYADCAEKNTHPEHPCAFNTGDLGIAIGSAVSVALDARVDNRIMYTAGRAAVELGLLGDGVRIAYAIPLSAGPKNPFFDRK